MGSTPPTPSLIDPTRADIKSAKAIIEDLLYLTPTRRLLYVTDMRRNQPSRTLEHLSCFLPGLLALGAHTLALPASTRETHAWAARGLAETCWVTYADMRSGLGPDEVAMAATGPAGEEGARWVDALAQWQRHGAAGTLPPGVGEARAERDRSRRDYTLRKAAYLLRPEVRGCLAAPRLVLSAAAGDRELLHHVAHNGRAQVARAWLGCFRSH